MVKVIPARIENGHVVPESALPPSSDVERVSIVVETRRAKRAPGEPSTFELLRGLLAGYEGDPKEDYIDYLVEKYR